MYAGDGNQEIVYTITAHHQHEMHSIQPYNAYMIRYAVLLAPMNDIEGGIVYISKSILV